MSRQTGFERLGRDAERLRRLPPLIQGLLAAGFVGGGLLLFAFDVWPVLVLLGILAFQRYGSKKADRTTDAPEPERAQQAVRAAVHAVLSAKSAPAGSGAEAERVDAVLQEAARQAAALAQLHPDTAKLRPRLLRSPPVAPPPADPEPAASAGRPIVEDGGGFWRRRRSRSGSIVE